MKVRSYKGRVPRAPLWAVGRRREEPPMGAQTGGAEDRGFSCCNPHLFMSPFLFCLCVLWGDSIPPVSSWLGSRGKEGESVVPQEP